MHRKWITAATVLLLASAIPVVAQEQSGAEADSSSEVILPDVPERTPEAGDAATQNFMDNSSDSDTEAGLSGQ